MNVRSELYPIASSPARYSYDVITRDNYDDIELTYVIAILKNDIGHACYQLVQDQSYIWVAIGRSIKMTHSDTHHYNTSNDAIIDIVNQNNTLILNLNDTEFFDRSLNVFNIIQHRKDIWDRCNLARNNKTP